MRVLGYILGGAAVAIFALAALPIIPLWLLAALALDIADGGLLA